MKMVFIYGILLCFAGSFTVIIGCDIQRTEDCSSNGYKYQQCATPVTGTYVDMWVIQQYSRSSCTLGSSYGFQGSYIWVDNGCRAKFGVYQCNNYHLIDCDSNSYKYAECVVPGAASVTFVNLASQKSRSPCVKNSSYGINGNKIWVNNGCRARFHVCYH